MRLDSSDENKRDTATKSLVGTLQDKSFVDGPKAHIHHRDGYEGVLAVSPPKNRRGLVLIDPSYEIKSEYDQVVDFSIKLNKKWPEAIIMIWYPILKQGYQEAMKAKLAAHFNNQPGSTDNKLSCDEVLFSNPTRMLGSGVVWVNKTFFSNLTLQVSSL